MAKTWILDTETKGTGATVRPLEEREQRPRRADGLDYVDRKPAPRPEPAVPPARRPRRFKVVDVMTGQALAQDASVRATVDVLEGIHSTVDVHVFVWHHEDERWRLLTHREQQALWELRGR